MLVLSRTRDESIIIGDNVVVTVVDVRGDKVKLGIEAPQDVSVHRREVYEAIRRENQQAAKLRPEDAAASVGRRRPRDPSLASERRACTGPALQLAGGRRRSLRATRRNRL